MRPRTQKQPQVKKELCRALDDVDVSFFRIAEKSLWSSQIICKKSCGSNKHCCHITHHWRDKVSKIYTKTLQTHLLPSKIKRKVSGGEIKHSWSAIPQIHKQIHASQSPILESKNTFFWKNVSFILEFSLRYTIVTQKNLSWTFFDLSFWPMYKSRAIFGPIFRL